MPALPTSLIYLHILDFKTFSSLKYGKNIHGSEMIVGTEILDISGGPLIYFYQSVQY